MRRRAEAGRHLGHLAERHRDAAALGTGHEQRQRREIADPGARLGLQADVDVARLAGRVDPVAGVEAGERHPQRLSDLADAHAEAPGQPAIDRDVDLRLLAARRQADVHGARHLLHFRLQQLRQAVQLVQLGPAQLQLDLLLVLEVAAADAGGHAAEADQLRAQARLDDRLPLALALRLEPHVDDRLVDRLGAAADRRVGVEHLAHVAGQARHFLRLQLGVVEARARRRLDVDQELRFVRVRQEAAADQAEGRQRQGADERGDGEQHHREAMVQGPADDALVALRLAIEPAVEHVEAARDERALRHRRVRVGPVRRQHRVERERHEQRHQHRAGDGQRERLEPLAGEVAHEGDRDEDHDDRERRGGDRERDLGRCLRAPPSSDPCPSRRAARCSRARRWRRR